MFRKITKLFPLFIYLQIFKIQIVEIGIDLTLGLMAAFGSL